MYGGAHPLQALTVLVLLNMYMDNMVFGYPIVQPVKEVWGDMCHEMT